MNHPVHICIVKNLPTADRTLYITYTYYRFVCVRFRCTITAAVHLNISNAHVNVYRRNGRGPRRVKRERFNSARLQVDEKCIVSTYNNNNHKMHRYAQILRTYMR